MPGRRTAVAATLAIAAVLGACGAPAVSPPPPAPQPPPEVRTETLTVDGVVRRHRLYVPGSLDRGRPAPLVLVLHGGRGSAEGAAAQTGFDAEAERGGFLVVYPQGLWNAWNAGGCCGPPQQLGVDDVGYLTALVDHLAGRYRVDPTRVHATGISNGGMMAYRLACDAPGRVASIAPVAATLFAEPCTPAPGTSVLHVHSVLDRNVLLDGGVNPVGFLHQDRPPVRDGLARFAAVSGCAVAPTSRRDGAVVKETWACDGATLVRLVLTDDGGHSWPGGERMVDLLDPPSPSLDASGLIARFFANHPATP